MTKDYGLGHARERGVTGFTRKTFHQLRRRVAVGGHHLSLAALPQPDLHRNFPLRFCHEQSVSIFSSLQVLPSSHYFTAFQRNFHSLCEINLRFSDPPTSVWPRFRITSHGGPLPVHGITIQEKLVSMLMQANYSLYFFRFRPQLDLLCYEVTLDSTTTVQLVGAAK